LKGFGIGSSLDLGEEIVKCELRGKVLDVGVPEDAGCGFEAEPCGRDASDVGAGAGEFGDVG
jgi:hypothetical protein